MRNGRRATLVFAMVLFTTIGAAAETQDKPLSPDISPPEIRQTDRSLEMTLTAAPPMRVTKRLFQDNPGCARVKLDFWFERGRYTSILFMMGSSSVTPDRPTGAAVDNSDNLVIDK